MKFVFALFVLAVAASDYFLQFTDQHYDWKYIEGGNPVGTICHTSKKGDKKAGHYGYIDCQSPPALVDIAAYEASKMFPDPQFIIITGDQRVGIKTTNGQSEIKASLKNVTNIMKKWFPKTKMYWQFGNHDVDPNNHHSPENTWMYKYAADLWKDSLDDDAYNTLAAKGYYKQSVAGDYTVIGLNTCYLEASAEPCKDLEDPAGMLAWLNKTLAEMKTKGEKAYIMGHCYFHSTDLIAKKLDKWVDILRENKDAVEALFFGHAHTDFFQLIMDKKGYDAEDAVPVGVAYVCPSVTPRPAGLNNHHPTFRVYRRNSGSMDILSHETYVMNLDQANNKNITEFKLLYSTADSTNFPELAVASPLKPEGWYKMYTNVVAGGDAAVRKLWERYNVYNVKDSDEMTAGSAKSVMCYHRFASDAEAHQACLSKGYK